VSTVRYIERSVRIRNKTLTRGALPTTSRHLPARRSPLNPIA
jgi:hypothetical protein